MTTRCCKCKDSTKEGSIRTAEGRAFELCKDCSYFLDTHPTISIRMFLGPNTWLIDKIQKGHNRRVKREACGKTLFSI